MWNVNGVATFNETKVQEAFHLKYKPIVKSLLDSDLYKYSMGQAYHHQFGEDIATWAFKARNVGPNTTHVKFTEEDIEEIRQQIIAYCHLMFSDSDLEFLEEKQPWIHKDYINFLRYWKPNYGNFDISTDSPSGLKIHTHGVQEYVSYYEIPILAIVAEVYYRNHFNYDELLKQFKASTEEKLKKMRDGIYEPGIFSEFGTRRRLSYEAQDWLIARLVEEKKKNGIGPIQGFVGTSNVHFAKKYGIKAVGTMAHEWIMSVGQGHAKHNVAYSNWYALDAWVKEYGVWNGIALTDTIGTDVFLKDFQKTFATLFSGVRHDSGDLYKWADKMIAHYKSLGIDPLTKTLMFSDGLNLEKATALNKYLKGKAKVAFGIGTDWTGPQDFAPWEPLNIVHKVVRVNDLDVAKLSDAPGKNMCANPEAIERLKSEIAWRMKGPTTIDLH